MKRFSVTAITRDRDYDFTYGSPESKILYFTANPNGEAEVIKVTLDPSLKIRKYFLEEDFSEVPIKGRGAKGITMTKHEVMRISLKSHGHSTLGGRKVWFDPDVKRLNYDDHGKYLGEFNDNDLILVVLKNYEYYTTNFDVNNHYEDDILIIEKWNKNKVWSAVLFDGDNKGYPYIKRFMMESSKNRQTFIGENPTTKLVIITDNPYPRIKVTFGGADAFRAPMIIDIEEFVGVKGFKARGKRISTWAVDNIEQLESIKKPEDDEDNSKEEEDVTEEEEIVDPDDGKNRQQLLDEKNGQLSLFDDDDI